MSSSFLSALALAKERIESASSQLSLKLQMSLNSSPPVPCSTVSRSQLNINPNQQCLVPKTELQKATHSNSLGNNSTATTSIKYSDPVMVTTNSKLNVSNSDIQNFVVSKSSEYPTKSSESTIFNVQASSLNNAKYSINSKSSTPSSNVSVSSSMTTQSVTTVACGGLDFRNVEGSSTYSCGSRNCNLPSCTSNESSYQFEPSMKNLNFENTIPQKMNSCPPAETLISPIPNCVSFKSSKLQNSAAYLVSNTISPVSNTDSTNLPVKTISTDTAVHLPLVRDVTSVPPRIKSRSSKLNLLKLPNSVNYYNPKRFCVFCEISGHSSHNCNKFRDSSEFWNIIYQKRLCKNCLRPFHFSHKCFDNSLCFISMCRRRDKHSPILCKHSNNLNKSHLQYNSPDSSSESYQDVCFNLNSYCKKKFYSQGTQTNFVESKSCQTQTLSYEEIAFYSNLFNSHSHLTGTFDSV